MRPTKEIRQQISHHRPAAETDENTIGIGSTLSPPALQFKTDNTQRAKTSTMDKSVFTDNATASKNFIPAKKEQTIQQKSAKDTVVAPFQLKQDINSSQSLSEDTRASMENALSADFSNVNIHANSQQATNVGALAYTQGNDVHFAPGQYQPNSQSGKELLGHELTHVVQQREGRVKPTTSVGGMPVNDNAGLENEADSLGKIAAKSEGGQTTQKKSKENNTSTSQGIIQG
jgi:hypothetical protein